MLSVIFLGKKNLVFFQRPLQTFTNCLPRLFFHQKKHIIVENKDNYRSDFIFFSKITFLGRYEGRKKKLRKKL